MNVLYYIAIDGLKSSTEKGLNKMTLRIQPPGLPDRILSMLGKERAVFTPPMNERYGYYIARRESFLRALLRSRSKSPPEGWMYWKEPETNNSESKEGE